MARSSSTDDSSAAAKGTSHKSKYLPATPEVVATSFSLRTFVEKKQESIKQEVPRCHSLRENIKTMQTVLERMLEMLDRHVTDIAERNKIEDSWNDSLNKYQLPMLKSMCAENGLPVGGCKLDLISRLLNE